MMTRFFNLLSLCALGWLTACAGDSGVLVHHVSISPLYSQGLVQWVGGGRDLPVRITGNPTDMTAREWDDAVTGAMNASGWLSQSHLTTRPGETARGNFHIAVMFDAPAGIDDGSVCRGDPGLQALAPADGISLVALVFCNDSVPVTAARASVAAIGAAEAPQLRKVLAPLLQQAFPHRNPNFPSRTNYLNP